MSWGCPLAVDGPVSLIRFQSGDFSADVAFDAQGLVVDYPALGQTRLNGRRRAC